jgi:hypothetical protein
MLVGMDFRNLPVKLSPITTEPKTLGISLQNRWEGKIMGIREMKITIPSTMNIKSGESGQPECNGYIFSSSADGEHTAYTLQKPEEIKEFEPYKTFRCPIEFSDVSGILGTTPIATRYFNVEVKYDYLITKEISVRVENSTLYKRT